MANRRTSGQIIVDGKRLDARLPFRWPWREAGETATFVRALLRPAVTRQTLRERLSGPRVPADAQGATRRGGAPPSRILGAIFPSLIL